MLRISKTGLSDLVDNIGQAQKLAEDALAELKNGNYTYEKKYVEEFGQEDYIYTLNKGEELAARMDELYYFFSDWLAGWEL